jgi:hypothetical protein
MWIFKKYLLFFLVFLIFIVSVFAFPSINYTILADVNGSVVNRSYINIEVNVSDIDGLERVNIFLYDDSLSLIRETEFPSAIQTFTSPNYGVVSFSGTPLVTENSIIVGGDDGVLFQINKDNLSDTIHTFTATGGIASTPILSGGYIYIGDLLGYIYQLDANDISSLIATYDDSVSGRGFINSVVVSDGFLYTGNNLDGIVYKLNASNISQVMATFDATDSVTAPIIVSDTFVYAIDNSHFIHKLYAFNLIEQSKSSDIGGGFGELTIDGNYLYVADGGGIVRKLNASNLTQQFYFYNTGTQIATKPLIVEDYLYIGNYEPRLYQFNKTDLSLINDYVLGGASFTNIVYQYGNIYVSTGDNYISQFDANNISILINSYTSGIGDNFYPSLTADNNLFVAGSGGLIYQLSTQNISTPTITGLNMVQFNNLADGLYYFNASVNNILGENNFVELRNVKINTSFYVEIPMVPPLVGITGSVVYGGFSYSFLFAFSNIFFVIGLLLVFMGKDKIF